MRWSATVSASVAIALVSTNSTAVEPVTFSQAPVFNQRGGIYTEPVSVQISSLSENAEIRYTIDGKEPGLTSPLYSESIIVSNSVIIRARCFEPGALPSSIAAEPYTMAGPDLQNFSSNLPLIIINTFTRNIPDGSRIPAYFMFMNKTAGRNAVVQSPETIVRAGMEVRGSSSTQFPKKSYGFEVQDEQLRDLHVSLLGFPREADWILYAPYTDKSLMRDVLAYDLSEAMGHYAVRRQFVEVFLDNIGGKLTYSDYLGVYVLLEKIKQDKNRVDIEPLPPTQNSEPEVAGGYLLKKDRLDSNDSQFSTVRGQALGIEEPKQTTVAQRAWIKRYVDQFETALYGTNYRDPILGYAKYIDVDSFIDHHWMVELSKNIDGFRLSEYMHKPRGGKLFAGPIWDYNLSFGNANYLEGFRTNGWYWSLLSDSDYPWRRRLFQDPDFNQKYIDRWAELRKTAFASSNILGRVDEIEALLSEAAARNYQRWRILGTYVWPNPVQSFTNRTYQGEVSWMKKWIEGRLAWIDRAFLEPPRIIPGPGAEGVTLSAPNGTAYYTLDGTDPRLPGGQLSPSALAFSFPFTLADNTKVIARAARSNLWSAPSTTVFVVNLTHLGISELMYHPPRGPGRFDDEDYEYIKLQNYESTPVPLAGIRLAGAVDFTFPQDDSGWLQPGESILVVKNLRAFEDRYGRAGRIAGEFKGNFGNGGEAVKLLGPADEVLADFIYRDYWQPATDGAGWSLVAKCFGTNCHQNDPTHWRASTRLGGSPLGDDPAYLERAVSEEDPPPGILRAMSSEPTGPFVRIGFSFQAAAAIRYSFEVRDVLTGAPWQSMVTIPSAPTNRTVEIFDGVGRSQISRFYRLAVEETHQ